MSVLEILMRISYSFPSQIYSYSQKDNNELSKLNFLITNSKGDFINLGVEKNSSKFYGLNVCKNETLEIFKFIEEITPVGLEAIEVVNEGYRVIRKFKSGYTEQTETIVVEEETRKDHLFGERGDLKYDEEGKLIEEVSIESNNKPYDIFYLGPSGGMVYEIFNFEGSLLIDLDMKLRDDFDTLGREYEIDNENGIIFVEYTKKDQNNEIKYKQYLGVKAVNFSYEILGQWVEKFYSYSKIRNSLYNWYVYRFLKVNVNEKKRIIFGAGFSKEEVIKQIELLDVHQDELMGFQRQFYEELSSEDIFEKPLTQDVSVSYKLSKSAMYHFMNMELNNSEHPAGAFAGYPWFSDVWARDELVSLRSFINMKEEKIVRQRLDHYLNQIDKETGGINILQNRISNKSCDATFWLAKRLEDFFFYLAEKGRLSELYNEDEIKEIYHKLTGAFAKIIKTNWDYDEELLKVKYADSWMDTVEWKFPLEVQVQFMEFVSFLAFLSDLVGERGETDKYLDFEEGMREKIRVTYLKNWRLYNDVGLIEEVHNSNVFLAYYIYPDLFKREEWERIVDNALKVMRTSWGGISSVSKKASCFKENYTGETNESYHRGDSWYWINNLCAIVLNDLNEKKYRRDISKILLSSTSDILKKGTIGYGSEVSSASEQRAEGCLAQMWSSATYIEMVDKIFGKR